MAAADFPRAPRADASDSEKKLTAALAAAMKALGAEAISAAKPVQAIAMATRALIAEEEKQLVLARSLPTALQPANVALAEIVKSLSKLADASVKKPESAEEKAKREAAEARKKDAQALKDAQQGTAGFIDRLSSSVAKLGIGLSLFQNFVGNVSSQIGGLVQQYDPTAYKRFNLAVQDTQAAIGSALLPVLNNFREVVRGIGSVFASLTPRGQALIAGLAAAGVAMGTMTVFTAAFSAAVSTATFGLSAVLGAVAGALAGVTTGLAGMAFALKDEAAVQEIVAKFAGVFADVLNTLADALVPLAQALMPIADIWLADFADGMSLLAAALKEITPLIYVMSLGTAELMKSMAGLYGVFGVLGKLARMMGVEAKPGRTADGMAVRNVSVQTGVDSLINKTLQEAFSIGNVKPEVQQVNLLEQANAKLEAINNWLTKAEGQLTSWKNDLIIGIKDAVLNMAPGRGALDLARRAADEALR